MLVAAHLGLIWGEEETAKLRKLWAQGLSASQIARALGTGRSRNSVIGRIHRIGLAGRIRTSRVNPNRIRRPKAQRVRIPPTPLPAPVIIPKLDPVTLADGKTADVLTICDGMCKFPIGDPNDADFSFCARIAVRGSYCADHARLAYLSPSKRHAPIADHARLELRREQWVAAR